MLPTAFLENYVLTKASAAATTKQATLDTALVPNSTEFYHARIIHVLNEIILSEKHEEIIRKIEELEDLFKKFATKTNTEDELYQTLLFRKNLLISSLTDTNSAGLKGKQVEALKSICEKLIQEFHLEFNESAPTELSNESIDHGNETIDVGNVQGHPTTPVDTSIYSKDSLVHQVIDSLLDEISNTKEKRDDHNAVHFATELNQRFKLGGLNAAYEYVLPKLVNLKNTDKKIVIGGLLRTITYASQWTMNSTDYLPKYLSDYLSLLNETDGNPDFLPKLFSLMTYQQLDQVKSKVSLAMRDFVTNYLRRMLASLSLLSETAPSLPTSSQITEIKSFLQLVMKHNAQMGNELMGIFVFRLMKLFRDEKGVYDKALFLDYLSIPKRNSSMAIVDKNAGYYVLDRPYDLVSDCFVMLHLYPETPN